MILRLSRQGDAHDLVAAAHLDLESIPGGHGEISAEFKTGQKKLSRIGNIRRTMTAVLTLAFSVL